MPILALTDITVRSLKPGLYLDKKTPAFGIRVGKNRRTWIVLKEPNRTKISLGHYPDLSLADARKRAMVALGSQTLPKEASVRFTTALERFLEENYVAKADRTKAEAKRLIEKHFLPVFQHKELGEITDADVSSLLKGLVKTPGEQRHAFRALRTMLRWCTRPPRRYIRHSPLEGYESPSKDGKRDRVLSDKELAAVWRNSPSAIRLLILWGARRGEVASLRRDWVEKEVAVIPARFTKNGRAHAIPILPMAKEIVGQIPNFGDYYFPGRHDHNTHIKDGSWQKIKRKIDDASGVKGWTIHDLRRTFRSGLASIGVPRNIAELCLNHVSGSRSDLDEIYDRYEYLAEKRDALQKWEAKLTTILAAV